LDRRIEAMLGYQRRDAVTEMAAKANERGAELPRWRTPTLAPAANAPKAEPRAPMPPPKMAMLEPWMRPEGAAPAPEPEPAPAPAKAEPTRRGLARLSPIERMALFS
jgi:hypothetical protein